MRVRLKVDNKLKAVEVAAVEAELHSPNAHLIITDILGREYSVYVKSSQKAYMLVSEFYRTGNLCLIHYETMMISK